jgi:hypothetical protein
VRERKSDEPRANFVGAQKGLGHTAHTVQFLTPSMELGQTTAAAAGAQVADTWKSVVHPSRPAPLPDNG